MYDELIKNLRGRSQFLLPHYGGETSYDSDLMKQAADAIEELMRYVQQMEKLRQEGWYLQKTKMMTYGQATMTMPLPQPPKEE